MSVLALILLFLPATSLADGAPRTSVGAVAQGGSSAAYATVAGAVPLPPRETTLRVPTAPLGRTGTIAGIVMRGAKPAAYAEVGVVGGPHGAMADEHGRYLIRDVTAGPHLLRFMGPRFKTAQESILVTAGETLQVRPVDFGPGLEGTPADTLLLSYTAPAGLVAGAPCPVHHRSKLAKITVPISYGLRAAMIADEPGERRKHFPFAADPYDGGCGVMPDSPSYARSLVCAECRRAESEYVARVLRARARRIEQIEAGQ